LGDDIVAKAIGMGFIVVGVKKRQNNYNSFHDCTLHAQVANQIALG
jgi:hypothetical protein